MTLEPGFACNDGRTTEITAQYLAQAPDSAAASLAPGELAYLALTSKVELPLRDRLAWSLSTKLPDLVVAREWKRTDLAILDSSATPMVLVEAKALYTFDIANPERANVRKYTGMVESDLAKAYRLLAGRPGSVFALVLVAHPIDAPPTCLDEVNKYRRDIHSALNKAPQEEVRANARATVSSALEPIGPTVHGSLAGGTAFGVRVDVDYSIVGPVTAPA
ncbi:hypothetical protein [Arthrobacter sp. MDT1-65]